MPWSVDGFRSARLALAVLSLAAIGATIGGCAVVDSDTSTDSTGPTASPVPSSTTTHPSTTPSTATPTSSTTTTPADVPEPPSIHLAGPQTAYSADGTYRVTGWVDRASVVAIGSMRIEAPEDPYTGLAPFEAALDLTPGTHSVQVTATDSASTTSETATIEVIVDPALETPIAYIEAIDQEAGTVTADYVEWLTGDEAVAAARADGFIGGDEDLPNGFYVRNRNSRLRTLPLADGAMTTLQVCYPDGGPCVVEETIAIDAWTVLVADPESADRSGGWLWYGAHTSPYRLTILDGEVVHIDKITRGPCHQEHPANVCEPLGGTAEPHAETTNQLH